MSRTTLLRTTTAIAAMMVVICIFARLSFGQTIGGVIASTATTNATFNTCLFDATGLNATFGAVTCPALTSGNMAACITAIEAVRTGGGTAPVVLTLAAVPAAMAAAQGTLAGGVVGMSGASGISVSFTFAGTVAATNIGVVSAFAVAYSTALNASADASFYFAANTAAAACATAGALFVAEADDAMTLSVVLAAANTTGVRFVVGLTDVATAPTGDTRCGFAANATVVMEALPTEAFTGDCEEVPPATYTAVDAPTAAIPTVPASGGGGDGGDGSSELLSIGLVGAVVMSLVALVL